MAYDPIVEGLAQAVGVGAPTYVDDLVAAVEGAEQAFCAGVFLLLAGQSAGLLIKTHSCGALAVRAASPGDLAEAMV